MSTIHKTIALIVAVSLLAGCGKAASVSDSQSASQPVDSSASQSMETPNSMPQQENPMPLPADGKSALTGLDTDQQGQRPVAVMMYNQKAAWPQWGIGDAKILIEANTEGQDTWVMGLYDGAQTVEKVGPVGQGRDLFLQMVMPLQAIPMYIGSDVYASNLVNQYQYQPLDGVYAGTGAYDLDSERAKVYLEQYSWYAHKALIESALEQYGQTTEGQPHSFFNFADGSAPQNSQGYELDVTYGAKRTARLVYNADDKQYYLYDGDIGQTDANRPEDAPPAHFTNVVLLMTRSGVKDNSVTRQYDLTEGEGLYLSGGGSRVLHWKKGGVTAPLQLFDETGAALAVQPGCTYLGIYGGFEGQALKMLGADGAEQALPSTPEPLPTPIPTPSPEPTPVPEPPAEPESQEQAPENAEAQPQSQPETAPAE